MLRAAPTRRPTRPRYRWIVLLSLAMLLAQTLGWMHRSWQDHAGVRAPAGLSAPASPGAKSSWIAALFDHDAGGAECRLYDAAGHPGCPGATQLIVPNLVPGPLLARTHAGFVARWAALFDARGPPGLR